MTFAEIRFPTKLARGTLQGLGFRTIYQVVASGATQRVQTRQQPIHRYRPQLNQLDQNDWYTLKAFYTQRGGGRDGFRYKDPTDFTTAADGVSAPDDEDEQIGVGDDTETEFQLQKTYDDDPGDVVIGSAPAAAVRTIIKPVPDTVVLAVDGTPVTRVTGTPAPGEFSVDGTTGRVTLGTVPAADEIVTAGCEFDVPVFFAETVDDLLGVTYSDRVQLRTEQLEMIEITDLANEAGVLYNPGGGVEHGALSADHSLLIADGYAQSFVPTGGDRKVFLWSPVLDVHIPGRYHAIWNKDVANDLLIRTSDDLAVATLAPGEVATVVLFPGGGGTFTVTV